MPDCPRVRTMVVMRHAKAEQAGATDYERELAERGWATPPRPGGGWPTGASSPSRIIKTTAHRE